MPKLFVVSILLINNIADKRMFMLVENSICNNVVVRITLFNMITIFIMTVKHIMIEEYIINGENRMTCEGK